MWSIIMTLEIVPVVLDELVLTVVVDNATDNLSSVDSGIPQLPEVVSLLGRIPATRHQDGHDAIVVFDQTVRRVPRTVGPRSGPTRCRITHDVVRRRAV